jgi:hypothetical protein
MLAPATLALQADRASTTPVEVATLILVALILALVAS